jgi:hypothetical protein
MQNVAQKLGIKPGDVVVADGQPLADMVALLGELPSGVTVSGRAGGRAHQFLLAADGLDELPGKLGNVWDEIAPNGRLWIWYRKGQSKAGASGSGVRLHRDTLQAQLAKLGMDGVTLVSINDTWSAMRVKQV